MLDLFVDVPEQIQVLSKLLKYRVELRNFRELFGSYGTSFPDTKILRSDDVAAVFGIYFLYFVFKERRNVEQLGFSSYIIAPLLGWSERQFNARLKKMKYLTPNPKPDWSREKTAYHITYENLLLWLKETE